MAYRRRAFLGGCLVALAGTAGCFGGGGVTDVLLQNDSDQRLTATVRVVRTVEDGDDEPVLDETATLDPDGSERYDDPVTTGDEYDVSVDVQGGPSGSFTWTGGDATDANGLTVSIGSDQVIFQPMAA